MDKEISSLGKEPGDWQSPEVKMEDKMKYEKHGNERGKSIFNNNANQFFPIQTGKPSISPRTSHKSSNCTQSDERKVCCNQCLAKFSSQSCRKQHLRSRSGDIALLQKDDLTEKILSNKLRYWKDKLIGCETLNLITDYPRPSQINYAGQNVYFELNENMSINLRNLAKELKVSLHTVLLSGYYLMLRIYSNQNDLVTGALTANSHFSRIGKMLEICGNTAAIRIQIDSAYTLKEFIKKVGDDIIESQHQDLPFEKLVKELAVVKDSSRHPIFQVMFGLQNFETSLLNQTNEETDSANLLEPFTGKSPYTVAKFDLTTVVDASGSAFKGFFNYATNLYKEETIHRFMDTYVYTLSQLSMLTNNQTKQEYISIADLSYLNADQYHQIIYKWNTTDKEYPTDKTIHQLFEEQVAKTPDNVAIVYKKVQLTYRELNERANRLANCLIEEYNIKPDNIISLCLDRSENMIIAILAILKSGAAYVPIDPSYPDERIEYILQDTSSILLLTNEIHKKRLKGISGSCSSFQDCVQGRPLNIISVDTQELKDKLSLQPVTNPNTLTRTAHLAYVIYTSGTTGNPKGVMVEHRRLANTNFAVVDRYALGDADDTEVILQFSNYAFEASVEQIFIGILNGHVLLLIPNQLWLKKEKFLNYLIVNKVTHIMATPRFLELQNFTKMISLKRLVFVGEFLSKEAYANINLNDNVTIINAYGSTETSAISMVNINKKDDVNIGYPMFNTKCYVLADNLVPVPLGAIGELYIGGGGLARGYLNRPDLTTEKFIANPFQTEQEKIIGKNRRLYKTGDLVRWLPDGNLEYIGRNDSQVKIRGYRIELGEIEKALLAYKEIKQSVALAKEQTNVGSKSSGNKYLVGYYVSKEKLDEEAIRQYLGTKLPEYMMPTFLMHLEKLPLTINGKLDRKALPNPKFTSQDNNIAPRNEIEMKACQIWAEVLGINVDKVGIHDDFFRLGGDSIVSIQLVSSLRKKLQIKVSVKDIFRYKSIARLYENVLHKEVSIYSASSIKAEHGLLVGAVPLLPIQEWFFSQNFSAPYHWNQSFFIKTPQLDLVKLQKSLDKLVQHHDCFRLRYKKDARSTNYEQYYDGNAQVVQIRELDIRTLRYRENGEASRTNLQELLTNWQANFELTAGPMYSVGYVYGYKDGSARIHFALHHLIVDTVSWRILCEDLRDIYIGKVLSNKGTSYRQWANAVKNYPCKHKEEHSYWKNILSDYDESWLNQIIVSESTASYTSIELSEKCTSLLLQECNKAYNTQINDLLLTALAYTLTEITGSSINHILLEGHGREEIDSSIDISRTLGWFTTIHPVRLEIVDALGTSIRSIKESLRTIPNKGLGFGPICGYKSIALPRVSINYMGQFGQGNRGKYKNEDIWQILGEDSGTSMSCKNRDNHAINISGHVMGSKIKFNIVSKLDENTTKNLGSVFKQHLEVVITHTMSQRRTYKTASDINYIISKERLDDLQESREIESIYLANNLQQGFIFHALSQGDVDDAYIVQQIWQYHCGINVSNLKQAWRYAQDKFSSLRLRFDMQDNLVQIIDKQYSLDWRYVDLSDIKNQEKQENRISEIKKKDRLERYDLLQGNLFRIYLIKQNRDLYSCIFSTHHAIIDGWSVPILLGYVHDTYVRLERKEEICFQPDYAYEAAQRYIQEHQNDDKAYWVKYVDQVNERSDLSGLLLISDKRLSEYKYIQCPNDKTLSISGHLYSSLKLLSKEEGVTLNAILQYVWHKVLHVYGNNKQTIVGTTLSGRSLTIDDIEKSVGLYINTLPLIVDHYASKRVIDSIKDIQFSIGDFHDKTNVNLAKLQSSGDRLFDSVFVYENYPNPISLAQSDIRLNFKEVVEKLDYPLSVRAYEASNELIFQLQYAGELFSEDTVNNLLYLTRVLLEQLPSHTHQAVSNLKYLDAEQYHQIIHSWNRTDKEYPADKTIQQLFEEQVAKTPNNVAIVYKEVRLNYTALNVRANQLAIYLIKKYNIQPDSLISLCLDRSEYMIIAILAVLKSGGAYVPIDPTFPDYRIQYILQDTSTDLLLTNEIYRERLAGFSSSDITNHECLEGRRPLNILSIDSQEFHDEISLQPVTNPKTTTRSSHLAYVIYTSGTTGKPKGVMVEHKGLVNLNEALVDRYGLRDANNKEVILLFYNYVFDLFVEQTILGILNGHELLIVPNHLWLNAEEFNDYLSLNKVTHIATTPRFLEQHDFGKISGLKRIVSAGDILTKETYDKQCLNGSIALFNAYGPTETSANSTIKNIGEGHLNIGSPIYNTKCYVLSENLVPVPVGAIGELYIGGEGLARGYLNLPDLTAERFIANPFQTEQEKVLKKNTRLYKTGDLVRWLSDGNLEYIERYDLQVKIRGYRIELGEIESALLAYEGIKQSVALAKEHKNTESESSGNKYLVGYYVSEDKLDEKAIRHYLLSKLPDYMVPTFLVHLNKIPLTINGKIDRKALPDPELTSQDNYIAPRNKIEEKACQIWAEVLGINADKVGTHDDFFRLGGDSIISIQLVNRLRKILQLNVRVKDIFQYKSIARLYDNVLKKEPSIDSASSRQTEEGILVGAVPLLPIQEWFFWLNLSDAHHWNQSFFIKTPKLDLVKLQDSLNKLVQHHDSFRLRYKTGARSTSYEQYYDGNAQVIQIRELDIRTLGYRENSQAFRTKLQELLTNWQANFELTAGPMYSVGYVYGYEDGSARIHFAIHHLIIDNVSWRIVCEDLKNLYDGKSLDSKGTSYRQWAKAVKDYPRKHQDEQSYWENILSDYDDSRLKKLIVIESAASSTSIELSQECTSLLVEKCNKAFNTQINDLLLTALGYSLTKITGCNINHILLEGHGREEIDSSIDISRTLGWFTTIHPVRLEIFDALGTSIPSIKESLRMIPNRGLGFGPICGYKSNALPIVSFNYLDQFGGENSKKLKNKDIWEIVGEDSGTSVSFKNRNNNVISFNGFIMNSRLKFNIMSKLDEKTTNYLSRVFKQQILDLISDCTNKPMVEYTMSDFNDFEPYVVFNQEIMVGNILFMFPPAHGGAESYFRNICAKLRNKKLIVFNNYYNYLEKQLGRVYTRTLSFEKLADDYITYIKVIQPKGPYNLFGWSAGGVLAFEISKKLNDRSDCVANLVLLDSYFNYKVKDPKIDSKESLLDNSNFENTVCSSTEMLNTNIILFKATKVEEIDFFISVHNNFERAFSREEILGMRGLAKFFTENTYANNLDKVLKNHKFQVVPINSGHYSWYNDDDTIQELCIRLEEL